MAMKPLDGTFKQNAEKHRVAGINIENARIEASSDLKSVFSGAKGKKQSDYGKGTVFGDSDKYHSIVNKRGRWPANILFDEAAASELGDKSRFFYCAKASTSERNAGLEGMPLKECGIKNDSGRGFSETDPYAKRMRQNSHPTVKPIKLMEYLLKLITPPNGGIVLDPFLGSGTTLLAAKNLNINAIGIEKSSEYCEIANARLGDTC